MRESFALLSRPFPAPAGVKSAYGALTNARTRAAVAPGITFFRAPPGGSAANPPSNREAFGRPFSLFVNPRSGVFPPESDAGAVAHSAALPVLEYLLSPEQLGHLTTTLLCYAPFLTGFLLLTSGAKLGLQNFQENALVASSKATEPPGAAHALATAGQWLGAALFAAQALEGSFDLDQGLALTGIALALTFVLAGTGAAADALRNRFREKQSLAPASLGGTEKELKTWITESPHAVGRALARLKCAFDNDLFLTGLFSKQAAGPPVAPHELQRALAAHPESFSLFIDKVLMRAVASRSPRLYRIRMLKTLSNMPAILGSKADLSVMMRRTLNLATESHRDVRSAVAGLHSKILTHAAPEARRELFEQILMPRLFELAGYKGTPGIWRRRAKLDFYTDFLIRTIPNFTEADLTYILAKIYLVRPELRQDERFAESVRGHLPEGLQTSWTRGKISGVTDEEFSFEACLSGADPEDKLDALSKMLTELPEHVGLDDVLPQFREFLPKLPSELRLAAAVRFTMSFIDRPGEIAEFSALLTDLTDVASNADVKRRLDLKTGHLGKAPGGGSWRSESLKSLGYVSAEVVDPAFLNSVFFITELSAEDQKVYLQNALSRTLDQRSPALFKAVVEIFERLEKRNYWRQQKFSDAAFWNGLKKLVTGTPDSHEPTEAFRQVIAEILERRSVKPEASEAETNPAESADAKSTRDRAVRHEAAQRARASQ